MTSTDEVGSRAEADIGLDGVSAGEVADQPVDIASRQETAGTRAGGSESTMGTHHEESSQPEINPDVVGWLNEGHAQHGSGSELDRSRLEKQDGSGTRDAAGAAGVAGGMALRAAEAYQLGRTLGGLETGAEMSGQPEGSGGGLIIRLQVAARKNWSSGHPTFPRVRCDETNQGDDPAAPEEDRDADTSHEATGQVAEGELPCRPVDAQVAALTRMALPGQGGADEVGPSLAERSRQMTKQARACQNLRHRTK